MEEKVGIFITVVTSMAEGPSTEVAKSRSVRDSASDCRRLTLKFRRPPWTGLGSPSALAAVDLPQEVLNDRAC